MKIAIQNFLKKTALCSKKRVSNLYKTFTFSHRGVYIICFKIYGAGQIHGRRSFLGVVGSYGSEKTQV